jgi:hypothetical protein
MDVSSGSLSIIFGYLQGSGWALGNYTSYIFHGSVFGFDDEPAVLYLEDFRQRSDADAGMAALGFVPGDLHDDSSGRD